MSNIDKTYFQSKSDNFDLFAIGYIIYKNIRFLIYTLLFAIIVTIFIYSTRDTTYTHETVVSKASNLNFILSQETQKLLNSILFSAEDILAEFNGNIISNDIFGKTINNTNFIFEYDQIKIDPKGIKLIENNIGEASIIITSTLKESDGSLFIKNIINNAYNLTLGNLISALELNKMELKKNIDQKRIEKKLEIDNKKVVLQNKLKAFEKEFILINKIKKNELLAQKQIAEELSYYDPQIEVIKKHITSEVNVVNKFNSENSNQLLNSMLPYYFYGTKVIDKEIELISYEDFMSYNEYVIPTVVELENLDNTYGDAFNTEMAKILSNYEAYIRMENEIKELFLTGKNSSKVSHKIINFNLDRIYTTKVQTSILLALIICVIVSLFVGSIVALIYHEYKIRDLSKII